MDRVCGGLDKGAGDDGIAVNYPHPTTPPNPPLISTPQPHQHQPHPPINTNTSPPQAERRPVALANTALSVRNWGEAARVPAALGLDPALANAVSGAVAAAGGCVWMWGAVAAAGGCEGRAGPW